MQVTKENIRHLTYDSLINCDYIDVYATKSFIDNLTVYTINEYINNFIDTDIHKIFIAKMIICRFKNMDLDSLIDKDISFEVYALLRFMVYKNKCQDKVIDLIKQFTLDNIKILIYAVKDELINVNINNAYQNALFELLNNLIFTPNELQIIHKCFDYNFGHIRWFFNNFKHNYDYEILKQKIIHVLYYNTYNHQQVIKKPKSIYLLRKHFANYLYDVGDFVECCCIYNLLTKDFIKLIYDTNIYFEIIIKQHQQYQDYIKALCLLDALNEEYNHG